VTTTPKQWQRHLIYRKECFRTTWVLRITTAIAIVLVVWFTRSWWTNAIADRLACTEGVQAADAILIDNLDQSYLLYERAESLRAAGFASRVLVPMLHMPQANSSTIDEGIVALMIRTARIDDAEIFPIDQVEPVLLNAALQVREVLERKGIRSVLVITSGFRGARSLLVYQAALAPAGVAVSCVPVFGSTTPKTWPESLHGIQEVVLQSAKLGYYRFYVLPRYAWRGVP
jgi:uncharacterized SAM-binding protein YcdF (DUF218 family)